MRSLLNTDLRGKCVLVRCDFNVPIEDGTILDTTRIDASFKTIDYLLKRSDKVCLCSHLGSPKGRKDQNLSLRPVLSYLNRKYEIEFFEDYFPQLSKETLPKLSLLENLRFYPHEESNDDQFSRFLAGLCDVYVNDAFSASHRRHASIVGVCNYVSEKYPGFLLEMEVKAINSALSNPARPLTILLGGLKVSTKLPMISRLASVADYILIGGAMANTFWVSQGIRMNECFFEESLVDEAGRILAEASKAQIILARDFVCSNGYECVTYPVDKIPPGFKNYDIGEETIRFFSAILEKSKTIIWNGPLGVVEKDEFVVGTTAIVQKIAKCDCFKIAGGGDTVAFLNKLGMLYGFNYVSLAGGAFLEYLERGNLPGIEVLCC
ncbi:MAG: phosphoglycerate kinase [Deltaproteobacteria bacterium]|nr:phosphoglycerate kinase [Deltaproteobacteria bacterium]